jgi:hypothetical protein
MRTGLPFAPTVTTITLRTLARPTATGDRTTSITASSWALGLGSDGVTDTDGERTALSASTAVADTVMVAAMATVVGTDTAVAALLLDAAS